MAIIKRSESPMPLAASDRSRRQSFINFSAPGHQQIIGFPQFSCENALGSFTVPRMGAQSPTESDSPSIYSHPSASYHFNPTTHSGFSSPASTNSSPNPYGDFNGFPLSPPNTGATLSSLTTQSQNSSHLPHLSHQSTLPFDLSSTISSTTNCEVPYPSHPCEFPLNRHARRESYSTTVTDPSYERRHSAVSVGSLRSPHSSSPYTNYTALDTNPGAQSQLYTLTGDLSSHGVFYMNTGPHIVPPCSELTSSNLMQPGLISDVPRLPQSPISHVTGTLPIPGKNTTRQYRKKTPPDFCAVCAIKQTPEWRKGPSGLRTLCNACGLTAAKHSLEAPTCIEEVWAQLNEIGMSRFRGKYELDEQKKAAAAQSWSSQSQATGRTSNDSPYYKTSTTPSPTNTSKSCRSPFPNISSATHSKILNSGNQPELDGTHQLYAVNRGKGNNLSGELPEGSSALSSPRNVPPMYLYSATCPPHAAPLSMGSANDTHPPPPGGYPHPLSSPSCDTPGQILEFYASHANGMNSQDSRLNSIGGDRMSISSIINQDPPVQSQSCFDNNAQVPPFHQQHQTQHLHHQFYLKHPPHSR